MNLIRDFITGFLIGLANLIPGVSGGTFALILGVYERLIYFLNSIGLSSITTLLKLIADWLTNGLSKEKWQKLYSYLKDNDYHFMAILCLGALVCIFTLSSLMKYLLINHFSITYGYFFGLIILSVIVPWRMLKSARVLLILPALLGILLTVGVTVGVNPYDKAVNKSELLKQSYISQQAEDIAEQNTSDKLQFVGKYSTGEYIYIFICGTIAISAMVLPGISGSLVLILLNQYFAVISAVANIRALLLDDILFLCCMAAGIIFGLISFARLIEYAFKRFHDPMISFLIGLIIGSLYSLWPFKKGIVISEFYVKEGSSIEMLKDYTVYSNLNILPESMSQLSITAAAILAGMITMSLFLKVK